VRSRKFLDWALLTIPFLVVGPAIAQVNHGDFLGTTVDFQQVTETTQSAGDAAVLWGAPELTGTGDQLSFFPPAFLSSCNPVLPSDTTSSLLTMTLRADPGNHITFLRLVEDGDVQLIAPPLQGTAATNATAAMSGTLTITEDINGPITPVVINWSGGFTPKATFELPGDGGLDFWNGLADIDVSAYVPNATEAVLAWDNTLTTNCEPGKIAKIQKKVVNGPIVTIMVNPLQCDLQIDKTCCVTQPVLPDLDICDGEVVRMEFEFTGDKCSKSNNEQGKKFKCYGKRPIRDPATITPLGHGGSTTVVATPSSGIMDGDIVTLTSTTGTFPNRTKLKIRGDWGRRQKLKIDTSCNRALRCDDRFGALKLVGLESTLGGYVDCSAPPPPPTCDAPGSPAGTPCDAKVVDLVLEYTGQACQSPLPNPQSGAASCTGDTTGAVDVGVVYTGRHGYKQNIAPSSGINDGDLIRVSSTWRGGLFPNQSYLITDASGVLQEVGFHTSCSEPFALGDQFGPFEVVEMTTKNGSHLVIDDGSDGTYDACEVPLSPPKPHCTDDLESLTLVYIDDYLGLGCTVSNSQSGYAGCSGVAAPGEPVAVGVAPGLLADPATELEFGDLVTITADVEGYELPWLTSLDVTGPGGTQWLDIKTSCYKPLSLGDRFGSFVVFGMDRKEDGPITLGGEIQYQYTVTNPNTAQVDNIVVDDDELGEIVSGVSLGAGASATFTRNATLYGTTTNVATANGDINGDVCDPGMDSLTVDVLVPPQGSFSCSCWQSMSEVTLIWDGTQTVDVTVWDGPVGSTVLATLDDVAPGDEISVAGFSSGNSTWEIFDSTGATKLGESIFKLNCWDRAMNGVEDCGKHQGDGKYNDPQYMNDWILEGMADDDESLVCTPTITVPDEECGFGPELVVILPGLMWLHRRRQRRA